jgi:hypothetical protein
MANNRALTAADVVITITVDGLFDTPTQLQGFAADNIIDTDAIVNAETVIGVDGRLSAAFVHNKVPQKIHLQADSESIDLFDAWYRAQQNNQKIYFASLMITSISTGKTYTATRGVMVKGKAVPDFKKKIEAQEYDLEWESVTVAPAT